MCHKSLLSFPGVPMFGRRYEPGVDWRRDPGYVAQGPLSRYVGPPTSARRRCPTAGFGSTHRATEPLSSAARELHASLLKTSCDADASTSSPVPPTLYATHVPDAVGVGAGQTHLRTRFRTTRP